MSTRWEAILRQIQRYGKQCHTEGSDSALLSRFAADSDPAAFETLLRRYGSMVYCACRRILGSEQDAEDAFQATFLMLVRKAGSIRRRTSLAAWLHKTAIRMSWKIQRQARQRRLREKKCARPEVAAERLQGDDLRRVLDEELDRLPDKYRCPLVLCRLLDLPLAEAADELGLSVATVWRRVQEAEELLRARLTRRGVAVSSAALVAALTAREASAGIPAAEGLVQSTMAIGRGRMSDVSARVLQLCSESGKKTTLLGITLATVIALSATVAAAYAFTRSTSTPLESPPSLPVAKSDPPAPAKPAEDSFAVLTGSVVDSKGQPVPNARLSVLARQWERKGPGLRDDVVANDQAGKDGRFQIRLPQLTIQPGIESAVFVVASASDGTALTIAPVSLAFGEKPTPLQLKLPDGKGISGVVIDEAGEPTSGAIVAVTRFGAAANDSTALTGEPIKKGIWPPVVKTGADGRFTIPGVDPTAVRRLVVNHPNGAIGVCSLSPRTASTDLTIRLLPSVQVSGRVIAADTGRAIAGAYVSVTIILPDGMPLARWVTTDEKGYFTTAAPRSSEWFVRASPPTSSQKYLSGELSVAAPPDKKPGGGAAPPPGGERPAGGAMPFGAPPRYGKGGKELVGGVPAPKQEPPAGSPRPVTLRLPRGWVARGQVVNGESGRPVPHAKVWFVQNILNPGLQQPGRDPLTVVSGTRIAVLADEEGKFELPAIEGEGTVLALAPGHEFVAQEIDTGLLAGRKASGSRFIAHTALTVRAPDEGEAPPVTLRVTPGAVIEGTALRDDGTPVPDGRFLCRHIVGDRDLQTPVPLSIRNGRFAIPSCRPGQTYTVQIVDAAGGQGITAQLRCPTQAEKPVTLRLAPLAEAEVELVTPSGRAVVGCRPGLNTFLIGEESRLAYAGKWWDPAAVESPTEAGGRLVVRGLIPGASYQLRFVKDGRVCYSAFEAKSGTTTRLKTIMPVRGE